MIAVSLSHTSDDNYGTAIRQVLPLHPLFRRSARRSKLGLRAALVALHLVYAGVLFLFDIDVIEKTQREPWYTALYLTLFVVTLIQYFITACTSPGYVLDAMRALNEANSLFGKTVPSKHPASSKIGRLIVTVDSSQSGRNLLGSNSSYWSKMVMELHPPGTSIRSLMCPYCNIEQPPRAKHCHDCDKWYICEETALCLWTVFLYISYLKVNIARAWWKDIIMIALLVTLCICLIFLVLLLLFHSYLVMTNQTTYELVRLRRIPYLRGIPERVYPFSNGVCRNLYNFCCAWGSIYDME